MFALIVWPTMLFVGIGMFAPRNKTVFFTLLLCIAALTFAIFLINDLSHPLYGFITVFDAPMRDALEYVNAH